jgi:hypothetical protein
MWQPKHPASEAVAIAGLSQLSHRRPPRCRADQALVESPFADRRGEPFALSHDAADRADLFRDGEIGDLRVRMGEVFGIDGHPPVDAPADIAEDPLAIDVLAGPDAPPAGDAAVGVERDVRMRGIDGAAGLQIGKRVGAVMSRR